ncbi:MAG: hypothetical protein ACOYJD_07630 [Christensenellales bacterium]|jgi:hypothetical protein
MKKAARVAAVIMVALFLALAPGFLAPMVSVDRWAQWLGRSVPAYQGAIKVWHVAGWKAGHGAFSTWLSQISRGFERRNFGVYIEIEGMTEDEAAARLQSGETADVYSFPTGFFKDAAKLAPIEDPGLRPEHKKSGEYGGLYALPYALGGYMLFINEDVLYEKGIDVNDETAADLAISASNAGWGGDAVAMYMAARQAGHYTAMGFEATGAYIGPHSMIFELLDADNPPMYSLYPLGAYTDMAQYVAVADGLEEGKREVCSDFAYYLLRPSVQKGLNDLGVIPVMAEGDGELEELAHLMSGGIVIPNCFTWDIRAKEEAAALAVRALAGDEEAAARLKSYMGAVVNGKEVL